MLKYIEICHLLNRQRNFAQEQKEKIAVMKLTLAQRLGLRSKKVKDSFLTTEEIRSLKFQAELCTQIFEIWKSGIEIMDEVDLLLHPLKSELNWPLGLKIPLDFTRSTSSKAKDEKCHGYRWVMPGYLLDAVFSCSGMAVTADIADSKEASKCTLR